MQLDGQNNCSREVLLHVVKIHSRDVELWCRTGDRRGTPYARGLSQKTHDQGRSWGGGGVVQPPRAAESNSAENWAAKCIF